MLCLYLRRAEAHRKALNPLNFMLCLFYQAKKKWLLENMSNEDEGRWRCAANGCAKLFKSSEFLQKHLIVKHGQGLEDGLKQVDDVFFVLPCVLRHELFD